MGSCAAPSAKGDDKFITTDYLQQCPKAGLTAAAARGRKGGRKPVVTADKLQRAREHIANGLNVREAATRLKVSKTALYTALQSTSAADS
ncbi:recombinase family protein [Escherichia coli]|nr:recombinase family protein [Salmonella enterica subsp. enterica]EDP9495830.1 recombinase family protein [Salmonella enterica subsp. enterica]NPP41539.1 recombinase family protein [Escherichia coli]HAE5454381.1 recombinase family protein [Salmonella enterica subsp. enterica serovar Derby]